MGRRHSVKAFLFIVLFTSVLLGLSQFGYTAYLQVTEKPAPFQLGTKVGPVDISGLTKTEAHYELSEAIKEWKQTHPVILELKDRKAIFPDSFLDFHISETLEQLQEGKQNSFRMTTTPVYFTELEEKLGASLYDQLLVDKLNRVILKQAETLSQEPLHYSVYQYVKSGVTELYEVLSEYRVNVPKDSSLEHYVPLFHQVTIQSNQVFSLLQQVEGEVLNDEQSLSMIASGIYGASLKTNFMIQERHLSLHFPDYADLGMEASVQMQYDEDLVVVNPNPSAYQLDVTLADRQLIVKVLGYPFPNTYSVTTENEQTVEPRTIVQYSTSSNPPQVIRKGQSGKVVDVFRIVKNNGKLLRKEYISNDYYAPVHQVERR